MPPEETADLEELEEFSKMFKQKRIKLGVKFDLTSFLTKRLIKFLFSFHQVIHKEMWVLQWGNSMEMISRKPQFPDLRL